MANLKRWKEVGGGDFLKWTTKGQSLEGIWRGTKPGKFGDLGSIETAEGTTVFPMHAVLAMRFAQIKEGAEVRVEYLGKATNPKTDREYKDFFVGVASAEDMLPPEPASDEEVPF